MKSQTAYYLMSRLFPLFLWAFGTFYFAGDLGKWTDDYTVTARNPATGLSTLSLHWTYPRPLGNGLALAKGTLLWDHDRLNHFIGASVHGLVVVLLWLFLRDLTRNHQVALAAALLYLVCPLNFEIIFWPCATHSGLAAAFFLLLAWVYVRFARGIWGSWSVALMIALAYAIPCWWEQPAAGIAALPLLYWAVARPGERLHRQLFRAIAPVACCALACWIYTKQVQAVVPPLQRGGTESIVGLSEFGQRIREVWAPVEYRMFGPGWTSFIKGAIIHGLQVLAVPGSIIWGILMAVLSFAWWRSEWFDPPSPANVPSPTGRRRIIWGTAFGLTIFCLAWAPVVMIRGHGVAYRMFYFPLIGLTIAGAMLLDWLVSAISAHGRKTPAAILGAAIPVVLAIGIICQMAAQSALRRRYAADQQEVARLRELVPQPCANAVFVPVGIQNTPAHTGQLHFDIFATGAFGTAWSAIGLVQQGYRRADVFGAYLLYGQPFPLSDFNDQTAHYQWILGPPFEPHPAGGCIIPISRMYPFTIDADGRIQLVDELLIEQIGGPTLRLPMPQVQALTAAKGLSAQVAWLQEPRPAPGLETMKNWHWVGTQRPVHFADAVDWGSSNLAATLRASSLEPDKPAAMNTILPAGDSDLDIIFRVTLSEGDLRRGSGGDAALLIYTLDQRQSLLAKVELRRETCRRERRWLTVPVHIPPRAQPLELHIEANQLSPTPRSCGIRVTTGHICTTAPARQ